MAPGPTGLIIATFLMAFATSGCLEEQPDSEITIGGSFGGVGGAGAATGRARVGDVGAMPQGSDSDPAGEHNPVAHEDKPSGFGAEDPANAVSDNIEDAFRQPGEADAAVAANPDAVGAANPDAAKAGTAPAGAALAGAAAGQAAPEGVPDAVGTPKPVPHEDRAHVDQPHVDRPPAFGSNDTSVAPAPPGSPGGSNAGGLPQIASPFERKFDGQKMVVVSGTISSKGGETGIGDIDCFVPDETSPAKRRFVNKIKVRVPGTYTMNVPADFGPLIISAFLDVAGDGPDPLDPQGSYEGGAVEVASEDVSDVNIILGAAAPPPSGQ